MQLFFPLLDIAFIYSVWFFLQAELNKAAAGNNSVEGGMQSDGKKANEKIESNNAKHHSVLLQVNKLEN